MFYGIESKWLLNGIWDHFSYLFAAWGCHVCGASLHQPWDGTSWKTPDAWWKALAQQNQLLKLQLERMQFPGLIGMAWWEIPEKNGALSLGKPAIRYSTCGIFQQAMFDYRRVMFPFIQRIDIQLTWRTYDWIKSSLIHMQCADMCRIFFLISVFDILGSYLLKIIVTS